MKTEENVGDQSIIWAQSGREKWPATLNLVPGIYAYGEKVVKHDGSEYRVWNPFRSKLAAALLNGLKRLPFRKGSSILYLGVSTGTTASHISDIIGEEGVLYGVEFAPRVAREFVENIARHRLNVVPIVDDARHPERYGLVASRVDLVYVDIAQPDQTEIAVRNCSSYLKANGDLLLVVKAPSIDVTKNPQEIVENESEKIVESGFHILQIIKLEPFDSAHWLIHAKKKG